MAGNTGKMTAEALEARGPRMRLVSVRIGSVRIGFVIEREGQSALTKGFPNCNTYASSYTLRYLLNVASGARMGVI